MNTRRWRALLQLACAGIALLVLVHGLAGQGPEREPGRAVLGFATVEPGEPAVLPQPAVLPPPTAVRFDTRSLPIDLPTALRLAEASPLDIAIAGSRLQVAAAQLQRAERLWLPTLYLGGDYYRHDGQLQDVSGNVFGTSKSTLMVGAGPSMVFAFSDALFEPLAARQIMQARTAGVQTAQNDVFLAVAEAYFNVLQARGDLLGAAETLRRSEELLKLTEKKVAAGVVKPVETARVRTEVARR